MLIKHIFILIAILTPFLISAQCSGDIVIKTQSDVNNYPCKEFTSGVLTISGGDIVDLSPLELLESVNGTLTVDNNPKLESLVGLHNIREISDNFNIGNNPALATFGEKIFALEAVGKSFNIIDNTKLTNNKNFQALNVVKTKLLIERTGVIDGFEQLQDCPRIEFIEYPGKEIAGFNSITTTSILNITACSSLEQISGFGQLEKIAAPSGGSGTLQLKDNLQLEKIDGFGALQTVENLILTGNQSLSTCCFLIQSLLQTPNSANVSSNATGCNSVSQINSEPSLNNCPSNVTVNTSPGSCTSSFAMTQPTPFDNCDLSSTNAKLTLADGSISFSSNISAGNTSNYTLQLGINVFEFAAGDDAGNETSCTATITVEDNEKPQLANCPINQTINTESNVQCSGSISYNAPTATDNCGLSTYKEKWTLPNGSVFSDIGVTSGQSFTKTFGLGASSIEYTAIDEEGNVQSCNFVVTVIDNKKPTLSGIPNSVTISCDDAFPAIPSPTAMDLCSGNLTSAITVNSSVSMGTCGQGEEAEVHDYSWTVEDDAGNEISGDWTVTVVSDFEFDLGDDLSLCGSNSVMIDAGNIGSSYLWSTGATTSSISVSNTGSYSLTVTSQNGCCFADDIAVSIGDNPSASAIGGVLSCTAANIGLTGSSSTSGVSYQWQGPGGFSSNSQNPDVSSIGTYTLTVTTTNGCSSTAEAIVTADNDVPNISAFGGELSCNESQTNISSSSTTAGVVFSWTGPNGFTSNEQNPTVGEAGIYTVTATSNNGCSSSADAEVVSDNAGPSVSLSSGMLSCEEEEIPINVNASNDAELFSWTGPSGFTSNEKEPMISVEGTYSLTATSENGCASMVDITVVGDFIMPDAIATGGLLSCADNETKILGSTTTTNPSFLWTGPNDFISDLQNPFISQPGTYTLVVTAENGCTASADAIVVGDSDIPEIAASGGTIDCNNESVTIQGMVNVAGATTSWIGPNGFATSNLSSVVNIPGLYTFSVTTVGGCQSFVSVNVFLDNTEPSFSIGEGFIDCEDGVRDFSLVTDAENANYHWTGPEGFTSTQKEPTYSLAGVYNVTISEDNGCSSSGSVTVDHDVSYTFEVVTNDGITEVSIDGGTPPFTFLWNDQEEGNSISNLQLGENFVRITDGLDCKQLVIFEITSGTIDLSNTEGVKIFPNPVSNTLYIELPESLINSKLEILSSNGSILYSGKTKEEIQMNTYPIGLYLIKMYNGEEEYYYKFLKL